MNQSNNVAIENKNRSLSPKYLQYIPYLYGNLIQLTCSSCKNRGSLVRSFQEERNLWIIRCNKCNTVIEIKKPKVIELENYKIRMMYDNENIMARILEIVHSNNILQKKAQMAEYQNKYRMNMNVAKKIGSILNDQQTLIANQQSKQFELLQKLVENDVNMKKYYMRLKKPIALPQKKLLYQIYKNEKKPSAQRLKSLEKELKISVNEIENWLEYFQYFEKYIQTQTELNQISQEIAAQLKHFQERNTNFFLSNESVAIIPGRGTAAQRRTTQRPKSAAAATATAVPGITIKSESDTNVIRINTSPRPTAPPTTPNTSVNKPQNVTAPTPASQAVPKKKIVVKKQKGGFENNQIQVNANANANIKKNQNNQNNKKSKKLTDSYDFLDLLNNTSSEKLIKHKMIDLDNAGIPAQINQSAGVSNTVAHIKQIEIDMNQVNQRNQQQDGIGSNQGTNQQYKLNSNELNKELDKEQYREVIFH